MTYPTHIGLPYYQTTLPPYHRGAACWRSYHPTTLPSTTYSYSLLPFWCQTLGGSRLLALLAHRMATENTWDQTAYNEEVGLPARGR